MSMRKLSLLFILFFACDSIIAEVEYELTDTEYFSPYSQTVHGGIGLVQLPTARFSSDGEFGISVSTDEPWNRIMAKMQFLPWFEAVVKYTESSYLSYGAGIDQTTKDKGFDVKFRLREESENFPQIALGFNDIGGTGTFSSEYIVMSKRKGAFDFSLGLGWGIYAQEGHFDNPLSWLGVERGSSAPLFGGKLNLGNFFAGDHASFFGGLEYFTPIENLSLKLEYDPSKYLNQVGDEKVYNQVGDIFELDSHINFSLNYRYLISDRENIDLSLGITRGNTILANFAVHSNLNFSGKPRYVAPPETLNKPYLQPYAKLNEEWKKYLSNLIIWQMGNEGLVTHNLIFDDTEMLIEMSQSRFLKPIQAIDLASRILANNSPVNIQEITVINLDQGIETLRSTVNRDALVNSVRSGPLDESIVSFSTGSDLSEDAIVVENEYMYPNFYWSIRPHANGTLQHQVQFYFWQLEALIHAQVGIRKGLTLSTDIGIDIENNFDDYTFHIPDGQLHHVRQDRRLYLTEGESGLRRLALDYLVDLSPNVKARLALGYLEWMYGGIGGEVAYMPDSKSWAISLDTYWVKQRDFDQKFGFQEYETVTGFLNFYYDLPFYNLRLKTSIGKFLGKDKGANIDISRRFETGARIGAALSLTDCDAACVGEGSFNKWIYFTLPMDLFYQKSTTRGLAHYAWSPLTKDAGTRVEPGSLIGLMTNAKDQVDTYRKPEWSIKKIFSGFSTSPKLKN